ncbi:phosphopeptide-binding protein [Streptomyces populi]|uniref:Phosphopeptide-binding protein n=1 Tax=Streptomyces populi TaxID=2058924 RepID=A0A2I0SB40_9ACTN|nr:FHA domain-containing protein [Streptomyces populi]PKT67150.1 phosphopeptide-binding protein [Streptomyces populi]
MPTCPNGHQSNSDDWCEVCGHRMAGVPPLPPPPPPGGGYSYPAPGSPPPVPGGRSGAPGPNAELCPQCRTPREGAAPFCEECRWNFLTNTATSYTPAAPRPPAGAPGGPGVPGVPGGQSPYGAPGGPGGQNPPPRFPQSGPGGPGAGGPGHDPFDYQSSRPSQVNRPAEPIPPGPGAQPYGGPQGFGGDPSRQAAPPVPGGPGAPQQAYTQQPSPPPFTQGGPPQQGGPGSGGPAFGGGDDDWVIPPPSSGAPGGPGRQGAPGGPGQAGGYGYPEPGATQAPPGPGYQQQPPPQQQSLSWSATIAPDREYFMAMMQRSGPEAAGLNLPAYSPELQRPLLGNQITIGRRRHSTGDTPDIDLSVPPEDPGVSHQHAVLVQQPDNTWAVVDQNSTNGTTVNGGEEPIQPFVPVPLQDGDRVHVGAWTTITIRRG